MFISLNRKIIYSILSLFLVTSVIFTLTFYYVYGGKIQNEQLNNIQRNQQYLDLLHRNIIITNELKQILKDNTNLQINQDIQKYLLTNSQKEKMEQASIEQERIIKMRKLYDQRYKAIKESMKVFGLSSFLLIISIIGVGLLITRWILNPLNKISIASTKVSEGDLSVRIPYPTNKSFSDELDLLISTFNHMLDSLENVISESKDKETFLQSLIDSIPDGIRVIDKDYNIIIANKAYYKQIAPYQKKFTKCYKSSQNIDSPCNSLNYICPIKEILHRKKLWTKVIHQFSAYPQRQLSINAAQMKLDKNKSYIVESIRDISKEINFSHQQKLSSLSFLSSSIAHEIKNHLGALRIIFERILNKFYSHKDDNDEEKKNMLLIYNELLSAIDVPERLLRLTNNSNRTSLPINIIENIDEVIKLLDYEAKHNGINLSFHHPNKEIFIQANETDFKMVAINIILNAIKATPPNGSINIEIKAQNNKNVTINFTDTGIGIPPENISRIFEPFFSDEQNSEKKGSGLGLVISKNIVENYNGKIEVSSTIGKGSCFSLSFPTIKTIAKK